MADRRGGPGVAVEVVDVGGMGDAEVGGGFDDGDRLLAGGDEVGPEHVVDGGVGGDGGGVSVDDGGEREAEPVFEVADP